MRILSSMFSSLSWYLQNYPIRTNMALTTVVGTFGDVVCQTIYEPISNSRPPLKRELLPDETKNSPFLIEMHSPYLYIKHFLRERRGDGAAAAADEEPPRDTKILVDLRRSFIFCSFNAIFGTPFYLFVYKHLDRLIKPATITRKKAFGKGLLSFTIAQSANFVLLPYVTFVDHLIIYREGRDGRRRMDELYMPKHEDVNSQKSASSSSFLSSLRRKLPFFSPIEAATEDQNVKHIMGHYYRFDSDKSFNYTEYRTCATKDSIRKIKYDFPDIVRYGLMFWSLNWLPLFYYIPGHFRLAYSQVAQVIWSGILSHLLHRSGARLRADMQILDAKSK